MSGSPTNRERPPRAPRPYKAEPDIQNGVAGEIAAIVIEKGFGFIKPADGSGDVFFHHETINYALVHIAVGQKVEFQFDTSSEKPRADAVKIVGDLLANVSGVQKSRGEHGAFPNKPAAVLNNPIEGEIASLVLEKGFGFIKSAEGGDDLFFHNSAINYPLESLAVGQKVAFDIDTDAEKPRAAAVTIVGDLLPNPSSVQKSLGQRGPSPNKPAAVLQNPLEGEIATMVLEKGFGFIKPTDGSSELFFHNSAINYPLESLAVGQKVTYDIDMDAEKPRAAAVVVQGEVIAKSDGRVSRERRPRGPVEQGFVTKILWKARQGFVSSDKGGPELLFDEADVYGEKKYTQLAIGDYVEFTRTDEMVWTKIDKAPKAVSVHIVEKELKLPPKIELPDNPRARRKKPTWRR